MNKDGVWLIGKCGLGRVQCSHMQMAMKEHMRKYWNDLQRCWNVEDLNTRLEVNDEQGRSVVNRKMQSGLSEVIWEWLRKEDKSEGSRMMCKGVQDVYNYI